MGAVRERRNDRIRKSNEDPWKALNVNWRDGLPADRTEDVANEVALFTAGLTSKYSSILRLNDGDAEATDQEIERIKEEQEEQAMSGALIGGADLPQDGEIQQSASLIQAARQGEKTGDTRTPEEGGNKPAGNTQRPPSNG